jgi:predicted HicB family RNase H-like nuclease
MDNVLKYKDFIGTVNFSAEDGVFYGKIEGIKSMVSFEGETVHDLEEDFKEMLAVSEKVPEDYKLGKWSIRLCSFLKLFTALL